MVSLWHASVIVLVLMFLGGSDANPAARRHGQLDVNHKKKPLQTSRPYNIAHRGSNGEIPEETAAAYLVVNHLIAGLSVVIKWQQASILPIILQVPCNIKQSRFICHQEIAKGLNIENNKIEFMWDSIYRRRVPSLEIGLMNFQRQIIFLRVHEEHVGPNFWHLQCTDNLFEKFAVTYIQVNQRQRCLQTMRESTFFFSPNINDDHHYLQDIHEASLTTLDETRAYVNRVVQGRNNGRQNYHSRN
ncbi:hypothetical protein TRIUR3_12038 [Triticum urartu]|uniref:Uncharacterized protein n=2 Tax=Triticum TaxID=4564 RepID=M7ZZY1_TRIUA|nr:hypothetical protein TRIUR3_12038 [Triticum urartu]